MNFIRNFGLGLRTEMPSKAETALSTAPASPVEDLPDPYTQQPQARDADHGTRGMCERAVPPQHSTVAQLSFGPATQQTVTTVTTTTTVSLPPLIMRPPKDLFDRDPKQYPLAFTPTPSYLKRFCADLNGNPIRFQEEEDARETVRKYRELQAKLEGHDGSIRREETQEECHTAIRGTNDSQAITKVHEGQPSRGVKRNTPPSLADAAELASLNRRHKKPRSQLHRTSSELREHISLDQKAAFGDIVGATNPWPVTPNAEAGPATQAEPRRELSRHDGKKRKHSTLSSRSHLRELQHNAETNGQRQQPRMADSERQEDDSQLGRSINDRAQTMRTSTGYDTAAVVSRIGGAVATPPVADMDAETSHSTFEFHRPNLPGIATSSQQDMSLPSPSLSPITAAANMAFRLNAFDASFGAAMEEGSALSEPELNGENIEDAGNSFDEQTSKTSAPSPEAHHIPEHPLESTRTAPTIMEIPTMVDAFDSMPQAMQTYLMYQLLRRCAKPTLQMVANVVNPALKCDPFGILPVELGLNIVRHLDVQSMCRAAQVSKKWRRHINSDEKAWRDLLERDGLTLPIGEIARAIQEGWGWQHPGPDGYEEDLSKRVSDAAQDNDTGGSAAVTVISDDEDTTSSTVGSKKRKLHTKHSGLKRIKRRSAQTSSSATKFSPDVSTYRIRHLVANSQGGPNALAHVAAQAVPHPDVGLPSLRNIHLFKSLYRRHHLIRNSWMAQESEPQHLAFRAHHRHVVTCLLFDSEKILTGSDDTKINVYDTKTGALKNRLEGHEGGVWALQYDGDTLVSGSTDRSVRIWDIKTGRCLQVFQGHTSTVRCLVILKPVPVDTAEDGTPIKMPKEPLIITGSRDSTLRVWKLPQPGDRQIFHTGPPANDRDNPYFLRTLSGHHNSVRAIAAHGDTLISGSYDCTVRVWKISNGDLLHRLQGHTQKVYSVVLDPSRKRCISGSMDNLVKVWDLQSGACLFNLEGHTSLVGLLDLSHDRLVSAAADSTLRIWDPETGVCKATLSAHTGAITCFQHDGQKVISGSDRTLKMWNVKTGECVKDLLSDLSGVWQVRFDERRCVAAVQRNNLTYIEASLQSKMAPSCSRLT